MTKALKHAPDGLPLFAIASAGMRRWRWAIWESRTDVRDDNVPDGLSTVRDLRVREPLAGGVAYSEAEALALVAKHTPQAIRIAHYYATAGHLRQVYAYRDQLIAEAVAANEEPERYARRQDEERARAFRAELRKRGSSFGKPVTREPSNVICMFEWLEQRQTERGRCELKRAPTILERLEALEAAVRELERSDGS